MASMRSFLRFVWCAAIAVAVIPLSALAQPMPQATYTHEYDGMADFPRYPLDVVVDLNALSGKTTNLDPHVSFVVRGEGKKATSESGVLVGGKMQQWHVTSDRSGTAFVRFQFRDRAGKTVCDTGEQRVVLRGHGAKPVLESAHFNGKRCWVD